MRAVAETVLARGRLFQPTISFTSSEWATDDYYLGVVRDIVALCGGTDEIVLCVKDMAGVGSITRIGRLIDAIRQRWPELVVGYHRHITDGLAMPALLAAAKAGAKIIDAQEDSLCASTGTRRSSRCRPSSKSGSVHLGAPGRAAVPGAQWCRWASPLQGPRPHRDLHRMPGGAFPSSFEQAQKGTLHLMPASRGDGALSDRALLRRHPGLPGHLGDLQRARQPRQGAAKPESRT
jgi:pyruvate carboxylase